MRDCQLDKAFIITLWEVDARDVDVSPISRWDDGDTVWCLLSLGIVYSVYFFIFSYPLNFTNMILKYKKYRGVSYQGH
jgi:hypothetical protein